MKKTMIAMAVAAALPVTAMADVSISGSVKTSFENSPSASQTLDVDSDLHVASTEVLANGMTATASFDVGSEGNSGKASLSGDFGTLTVGSGLDKDGAFQSGNIGSGEMATLWEKSTSASTANAVHYAGSFAGLNVQAQINASTTADETTVQENTTQIGATYSVNGLTFGYANNTKAITSTVGKTIAKSNTAGVAYSFGDLSVSYGKSSVADDATLKASYKMDMGPVALTAGYASWGASSTKTYGSAAYTVDGLTVAMAYDSLKGASGSKGIAAGTKTSTISATYVAGDLTAVIGTKFDGTTDYSVALDLGNADLKLARDDSNSKTTASYSVAF